MFKDDNVSLSIRPIGLHYIIRQLSPFHKRLLSLSLKYIMKDSLSPSHDENNNEIYVKI